MFLTLRELQQWDEQFLDVGSSLSPRVYPRRYSTLVDNKEVSCRVTSLPEYQNHYHYHYHYHYHCLAKALDPLNLPFPTRLPRLTHPHQM
jgi:hypothetical protein